MPCSRYGNLMTLRPLILIPSLIKHLTLTVAARAHLIPTMEFSVSLLASVVYVCYNTGDSTNYRMRVQDGQPPHCRLRSDPSINVLLPWRWNRHLVLQANVLVISARTPTDFAQIICGYLEYSNIQFQTKKILGKAKKDIFTDGANKII